MTITDEGLAEKWQQGDPAAFEALVRRWQTPVLRFLGRLVGCAELAQDLAQEVFLRVFLSGPRYREQGSFSTWLYQIALNLAHDAGRRLKPRPLPEEAAAAAANSSENALERRELAQSVADALRELPDELREVVVLRHFENINFEQMSRLLAVPASTLKSRFTVGLARLRQRLQSRGWAPEGVS